MSRVLSIRWVPKDALDGMQLLDAMEELAYRRLIDLYYAQDGNIEDDDKKLAWLTKTGRKWKKIKESLIRLQKITVSDHKIVPRNCELRLKEAKGYIEQKKNAAKSGVQKRKTLNNNNSQSADAGAEPLAEPPVVEEAGAQASLEQTPPIALSLKNTDRVESVDSAVAAAFDFPALPPDWKNYCLQERQDLDPEKVFKKIQLVWGGKSSKDWFSVWKKFVIDEFIQKKPDDDKPKSTFVTPEELARRKEFSAKMMGTA